MTRKEQIIEASIEYTMQNNPVCIGGDNFYEMSKVLNRNKSFEAGAMWADKNPQSLWINVEDKLPYECNDMLRTDTYTKTKSRKIQRLQRCVSSLDALIKIT